MSVSSGMVRLFATAAFCVASAGATAYILSHRDQVRSVMAGLIGAQLGRSDGIDGTQAGDANSRDSIEVAADASDEVTLRAGTGGHFETSAEINGRSVDVLVDTGATLVAMTYEDAGRAGIFPSASDFKQSVATANGTAKVAVVDIDSVSIGNITVHNIRGAVAERGKLHRTLLGMSFLSKLHVEMRKDELVLRN